MAHVRPSPALLVALGTLVVVPFPGASVAGQGRDAAALAGLNDAQGAERELRAVLGGEAPEWLHARARTDLGKLLESAEGRHAR